MRIIAGHYKGKRLDYPLRHNELKPTQDRIKESMFSMLEALSPNSSIENSRVIDLFSGTGNLAYEALSRGAKSLYLVDIDPTYSYKNKSILTKDHQKQVKIFKKKSVNFLAAFKGQADLIFLDPPWSKSDFYFESLKAVFDFDILSPDGLIICEHPAAKSLDNEWFLVEKVGTYGKKKVTFLCHQQ
jgi:16S rRNA (guanine966-N2)-methyltransferase